MAAPGATETVVDGGDTAVKATGVEPAAVKTAVKTTGVEAAAVETAAMPSASVPPASASVGKIWLKEDSRAQYRSCNTHHSL